MGHSAFAQNIAARLLLAVNLPGICSPFSQWLTRIARDLVKPELAVQSSGEVPGRATRNGASPHGAS
jgi:hypothetical protein